MNKQIEFPTNHSLNTLNYPVPKKSGTDSSFQSILTGSLDKSLTTQESLSLHREPLTSSEVIQDDTEPVLVGTTTKTSPTVSHVLSANDELKQNRWNIIYSSVNKEKSYNSIPLGASIYYDKKSGELSWSKDEIIQKSTTGLLKETMGITLPNTTPPTVSLGKVNPEFPTVSHLLAASAELSSEKWNILSASANTNKDFSKIPQNTEIWFNQLTKELSWQGSGSQSESRTAGIENIFNPSLQKTAAPSHTYSSNETANRANAQDAAAVNTLKNSGPDTPQTQSSLPPDLTEAVKPFIGTPYDKIDCYGLVINGLKKMGLPYSGEGGLRNKLTSMARQKGLPANAYLTGEGIVKATGKQVFTHSSAKINNWTQEADKIFQDMTQLLEKGQILSFSTPTRGHTGIISQHNDKWTFINSGRMDNHVAEANRSKEVGEEDLANEVNNWFKLAKKNREPLLVTLGQIEKDKIRTTIQPNFQMSQRI